jgi:hypothetical protein
MDEMRILRKLRMTRGGVTRITWLIVAGVLLEFAVGWLCLLSPPLTAGYNAEFTRQFLERFEVLSLTDASLTQLEIGLIGMGLAYVAALVTLSRFSCADRVATTLVVGFSLVFHVTFLAMPGLYSTDIFSYVMYGRIAGVYAQNPYIAAPANFATDPFLSWVFPFWQHTPSVYGPLWTDLSALLSSITADMSALDQVLLYKLVLWSAALANLGLVWLLTGRAAWLRGPRLACFAVYAWNPIVLLEFAGNAHNDALMVTLLLLSVLPLTARRLRDRHWLTAVLLAAASALIKFTTALVVPFYMAAGVRHWRTALAVVAAVSGVCIALSWPYLQPASALMEQDRGVPIINSIPDLIAGVVTQLGMPTDLARTWTRAVCALAYVSVLVWDLLRVRRLRTPLATLEASARALLLLPLLVLTWVWTWYFTWSVAIAAVIGIRGRLTQTIVAVSVAAPPVFYASQYLNERMPTWPMLVYVAVPLLALCIARGCKMLAAREAVAV